MPAPITYRIEQPPEVDTQPPDVMYRPPPAAVPLPAAIYDEPTAPLPVYTPPPEPEPIPPGRRTWRSASGGFSVEADFLSMAFGKVKLRRVDTGDEINVPIEMLSPEDRDWIDEKRM